MEKEINSTEEAALEKKNIYLEYALFLVLGFLLGIVIKTEAGKRITMGYNDYMVDMKKEIYGINDIQKKIAEEKEQPATEEQVEENGVKEEESTVEDQQIQGEENDENKAENGTAEGAATSR